MTFQRLTLEEAKAKGLDELRVIWNELCPIYLKKSAECQKQFFARCNMKKRQMTKKQYEKLHAETILLEDILNMVRTATTSLGGGWLEIVE